LRASYLRNLPNRGTILALGIDKISFSRLQLRCCSAEKQRGVAANITLIGERIRQDGTRNINFGPDSHPEKDSLQKISSGARPSQKMNVFITRLFCEWSCAFLFLAGEKGD
jgi:hypothetical protein